VFTPTALALACLRYGEPALYERGIDRLPSEVAAPLVAGLVASLERAELGRALHAATEAFVAELRAADPELASRLEDPLQELASG
jgi:hypothetical protein